LIKRGRRKKRLIDALGVFSLGRRWCLKGDEIPGAEKNFRRSFTGRRKDPSRTRKGNGDKGRGSRVSVGIEKAYQRKKEEKSERELSRRGGKKGENTSRWRYRGKHSTVFERGPLTLVGPGEKRMGEESDHLERRKGKTQVRYEKKRTDNFSSNWTPGRRVGGKRGRIICSRREGRRENTPIEVQAQKKQR